VVLEGCLKTLTDYMDAHPEAGIIGPKLLWKDRTLQWSCRKFPSLWNTFCPAVGLTRFFPNVPFLSGEHMGYFRHDVIREVDVLVGAFLMVRKEALNRVGLMDESYFMYSEEIDWCRRFRDDGWKILFHPQAQVIHYGGGSSSKAPTRFYREYCLSLLRYWKKHHSGASATVFRMLFFLRHAVRWPVRGLLYGLSFLPPWQSRRTVYKEKLDSLTIGIHSVFTRIGELAESGENTTAAKKEVS
jgi:GT2 family glycosyltransferase